MAVDRLNDGGINISQPQIIQDIINQVKLPSNMTTIQTPELATNILLRAAAAPEFDKGFQYRGTILRLNFLENSTCLDITYATHQCAIFSEVIRATHGDAVENLV